MLSSVRSETEVSMKRHWKPNHQIRPMGTYVLITAGTGKKALSRRTFKLVILRRSRRLVLFHAESSSGTSAKLISPASWPRSAKSNALSISWKSPDKLGFGPRLGAQWKAVRPRSSNHVPQRAVDSRVQNACSMPQCQQPCTEIPTPPPPLPPQGRKVASLNAYQPTIFKAQDAEAMGCAS